MGMIAQALLAIGTRQHYTVDIVVAILVGYWNFIWHLYVLRPTDMQVPETVRDRELNCKNDDVVQWV